MEVPLPTKCENLSYDTVYDKKKKEYAITTSDIVFSGLQLSLTYFSNLFDSGNLRENRLFKKIGL